jgi:hypothetical protein
MSVCMSSSCSAHAHAHAHACARHICTYLRGTLFSSSRLLQQREQLRARLIAEQERRERAEAELVSVGAQWLGTETQQALRERAESERRRALDVERESIRKEAEQRIARVRAENALLLERLGGEAPSQLQLQMQLRAALQAELEQERRKAQAAVHEQLTRIIEERDALAAELRRAEALQRSELEMLRCSVRKASEMMQEQFDAGFVSGLKQAALALDGAASGSQEAELPRGGDDETAPRSAGADVVSGPPQANERLRNDSPLPSSPVGPRDDSEVETEGDASGPPPSSGVSSNASPLPSSPVGTPSKTVLEVEGNAAGSESCSEFAAAPGTSQQSHESHAASVLQGLTIRGPVDGPGSAFSS